MKILFKDWYNQWDDTAINEDYTIALRNADMQDSVIFDDSNSSWTQIAYRNVFLLYV